MNPHRIPRLGALIKPATLRKFHQVLVKRKYNLLFASSSHRRKPEPRGLSQELIAAIVELKRRNPMFGTVRIAQQVSLVFSIEINKDVARRVLAKHYWPDTNGPSWSTLSAHAKDNLWSADLFRVESILLRSHWVMLVMDIFTRRITGFGVEPAAIDGPASVRGTADWNHPARVSRSTVFLECDRSAAQAQRVPGLLQCPSDSPLAWRHDATAKGR